MTDPWTPGTIPQNDVDPVDYFKVRESQGHLLLVRIQDEVVRFATKDCPDGMKLLMRGTNKGQFVPNNVIRVTIADLNLPNPDGSGLGKIYNEAIIFAGTLVKDFKKAIGATLLLIWKQDDPTDKSSPYSYQLMNENPQAVQAARDFLDRHPEFMTIPAPAPYQLPARQEVQPGHNGQQGYPPQGQWGQQPGVQQYPPAQPGYGPPPPGYGQPQPDPWAPPGQQTYLQHPPRGQQGNGSFLERAQTVNHHGQPQSDQPPY